MSAGDVAALLLAVEMAGRPIRARVLATALDLPPAEVRAALRQQQDAGTVRSHGRRWTPTGGNHG